MPGSSRRRIIGFVALYGVLAGLWIYLSDWVVALLAFTPARLSRLQTFKGWAFVAVTSLLLGLILRHQARARETREAALQDSEATYRMLVEVESDAVVLIDNETGRLLNANPAAAQLYGYSQVELLGMRNTDLSAEPTETARVTTSTPLTPETVVRIPLRYHKKRDGTVFPVEITGRFFTWRGRPVHLAAIRDITDRRAAEATLARYRILAEQARDIVLFVRRDGRILEANQAAVQAYEYSLEELCALSISQLRAPETHALTDDQLAQADAEGILFETLHRRKDGTIFPVEVSSRGTDLDGTRILLSIVRDITDRSRAEQALARRTEHLEAIRAVTAEITRELDLRRLLHLLITRAAELVGAVSATVYLWEPAHERLIPAAWHGLGDWQGALSLRLGEAVAGTVAQTHQTLVVPDYRTSPYAHPRTLECTKLTASLGEPLLYRDTLIGAITLGHEDGRVFTEADQEVLRLFAAQAAIAIENARLYDAAQQALRERAAAEAQLRKIVRAMEQSPSIVVITDATGAIEYVNPKFTEVTGYAFAEVRGRTPGLLKSGHTSAEEYARLWATLTSGGEWRGEFQNRRKDGTLYWEMASISPVRSAEGVITHYVGVKEDITARKAAMMALQRSASQLEALRATTADITRELDLTKLLALVIERAVGLLHGVSGAVYLVDPATGDAAPRAWVGHGAWMADVRLRPGEGIAGTIIQSGEGLIENAYRTSPYVRPIFLDRTRHAAVLGEPLRYRDNIIGAVLVDREDAPFTAPDRDLLRLFADQAAIAIEHARLYSDLKRSYEDLRQAQDELVRAEKLRGLGQMAAGIAHDLNNTLATILGQVELLRLRSCPTEVADGLALLQTAATDGAAVVRRLQDFARQRRAEPLQPCDLAQIVSEALELTRPRWQEEPRRKGIVIEPIVDLADTLWILGHPAELREALTNLIFNAVDAMPQGGTIRFMGRPVETRAPGLADTTPGSPPPAWVELDVADTGVGIPQAICGRIFDPFFTTKGIHGTGLGLSVVYGILERHGGRIDVTSAPGQGATFRLRLRAAVNEAGATATPSPLVSVPTRRILVVDDDALVRRTLVSLLRASGQDVIEAGGGAEALACLGDNRVDLVLTDLGMPDVTGWDVARVAKARHPDLPVILLTGWGDTVMAEAPPGVRVDRVLPKPVPRSTVLSLIAELTRPR